MTVAELIKRLQNLSREDQAKKVVLDGCDCFGDAKGLEVDSYSVTLTRYAQETS